MHVLTILPSPQVGTFDPYSDDPRLAIQKMCLCALSETLVVAGSAGQILIYHMERQEREQDLKVNYLYQNQLDHTIILTLVIHFIFIF